jgi:excisionase family DNA binding protein
MASPMEGNSAIPEYLTVEETARRYRVSAPTIYRRCADGSLPHIRLGDPGPIRIPVSQLERLYDQSVSDDGDGLRQERLRPGAAPSSAARPQPRGQSTSPAHAGPQQ